MALQPVDPVDNFFQIFLKTQEPPAIGRIKSPKSRKSSGGSPPLPPEPPFDE
jgi:hypothetical protein